MLFINKLFNSIACLLYFINLQLVIPGRTWILLYLGRTVYKRLWACLALYMYFHISVIVIILYLGQKCLFSFLCPTHSDDKQLLSIPANIIAPSRKPQTIHCRMNNQNKVVVLPKEPLTHFKTVRTRALSHPDNNNSISRNDADDSSNRDGVDNTESKYDFKSSRIFDARFSKLRNSLIPPYKPGDEYLQRGAEERENVLSNRDAGKHVSFLPGLTVIRGQTF